MLRTGISSALRHKSICGQQRKMSSLLCSKALIDGKWVDASSGETFEVKNPANGKVIGSVPNMSAKDAQLAIDAAKRAFYSDDWSALTAKQRSQLLKVQHGYAPTSHNHLFIDIFFSELVPFD